jgi:hypothetical protein
MKVTRDQLRQIILEEAQEVLREGFLDRIKNVFKKGEDTDTENSTQPSNNNSGSQGGQNTQAGQQGNPPGGNGDPGPANGGNDTAEYGDPYDNLRSARQWLANLKKGWEAYQADPTKNLPPTTKENKPIKTKKEYRKEMKRLYDDYNHHRRLISGSPVRPPAPEEKKDVPKPAEQKEKIIKSVESSLASIAKALNSIK